MDQDANNVITLTELNGHTARTSLDDDLNWRPVSGHRIRFRITLLRERNGGALAVQSAYIYYCDAQGTPVGSDGSVLPAPPSTFPPYREVHTDSAGIATFYIRAGSHWANFHTARIAPVEFEQRR